MTRDSPPRWSRFPLGALADYINGFGFSPEQWGEHGLPIVRIENMRDPGAAANLYDGPLPDRFKVVAGDLLLSWSATLMAMIWDRPPAWVNQHIFKVVPRPGIDPSYLHHLLAAALDELGGRSHGTTMKHVKRSDLLPFRVWVAPASEQPSIGRILDTVDDTIRSIELLIAKLEQMKQGLLHDLLTFGIDENGERRDLERQPEFVERGLLGRLPSEWQIRRAHEVCALIVDCKNRTPPERDHGHPVIRTPNVRDGLFVFDDLLFTDSHSYDVWTERARPRPGDVLITREAPAGEVCLLPDLPVPACLGQRMMLYRPDSRILRSEFLVVALQSRAVQAVLQRSAGGSTVGHIRVEDVRRVPLPIPSLSEQVRIASSYRSLEEQILRSRGEASKLRLLRKGLMDDLLTGRVRVNAHDECEA